MLTWDEEVKPAALQPFAVNPLDADSEAYTRAVSYTHLTLPTNREV